jgi:hypothetical protein
MSHYNNNNNQGYNNNNNQGYNNNNNQGYNNNNNQGYNNNNNQDYNNNNTAYYNFKHNERNKIQAEYRTYKEYLRYCDTIKHDPQSGHIYHPDTCRCHDCKSQFRQFETLRNYQEMVGNTVITVSYDIHGNVEPGTMRRHALNNTQKQYIASGLLTLADVHESFTNQRKLEIKPKSKKNNTVLSNNKYTKPLTGKNNYKNKN